LTGNYRENRNLVLFLQICFETPEGHHLSFLRLQNFHDLRHPATIAPCKAFDALSHDSPIFFHPPWPLETLQKPIELALKATSDVAQPKLFQLRLTLELFTTTLREIFTSAFAFPRKILSLFSRESPLGSLDQFWHSTGQPPLSGNSEIFSISLFRFPSAV
jgi:hypothetical protein